jgi:hypothetical protein
MKNMFAIKPNKYVYNKPEAFEQNIYKGSNEAFWRGYYAHEDGKNVVDFIELAK